MLTMPQPPKTQASITTMLRLHGIDANQIAPRIYQGAALTPTREGLLKDLGFGMLVLTAMEVQPTGWGEERKETGALQIVRVPLDDTELETAARKQLFTARAGARTIFDYLLRTAESRPRVLITCQQGRNRSGLVSALVLWMLGASMNEAISAVKTLRRPQFGQPLSNTTFVKLLQELGRR